MAETGSPLHSALPAMRNLCSRAGGSPDQAKSLDPCLRRGTPKLDWDLALSALRSGEEDALAEALAMLKEPALSLSKGHEVEEIEDPPIHTPLLSHADAEENNNFLDLTDRCWKDGTDEIWMTDFPPPADFTGYQSRPYDEDDPDEPYNRACTEQEIAILEADAARSRATERAEDEQLRDEWFALLKTEAENRHPGLEPGPA